MPTIAKVRKIILIVLLGLLCSSLAVFAAYRLTVPSKSEATDQFGVKKLHVSKPGGMYWVANWRSPREFETDYDPEDPWFRVIDTNAEYSIDSGVLKISGESPRMHVQEPNLRRQWTDVEITMYFMRVSDAGTPFAGMTAVARSNHGATGPIDNSPCDTRGLGGRLRFDGYSDFEREISHPDNDAKHSVKVWNNGMPKNIWIGYKFLVYDLPNGNVKMEMWIDKTNGEDGGDWVLVNSMEDNGEIFGKDMDSCVEGLNPSSVLNNSPHRLGSESGKPNASVYFRSDNINQNGLLYKNGSVREIAP